MTPEFKSMLLSMRPATRRTIAVASAADAAVLKSIRAAYDMGFADAILCGTTNDIVRIANDNDIDISPFQIIDCSDDASCASMAVSLVRVGTADILMKGLIHTADILRAVLNRDTGIRGDGILSHVAAMYSPSRKQTLFLTDIAMVMYPDLDKKVGLINNAVSFAKSMGAECPRVACLCAVETVNPAMQATLDATALHEMNLNGQIPGCIVSGPLAFDIAVSRDAARVKGVTDPVAGNADILLFHNIEAGNNTIKSMVHFGDWLFGGVVLGARAPIVLNSRSDSDVSKLYSIACACKI